MTDSSEDPRLDLTRWLRYARAFFNRRLADPDDADSAANIALAIALAAWDGSRPWKPFFIVCLRRRARDEGRRHRRQGISQRGRGPALPIPARVPMPADVAWRVDWVLATDARLDCERILARLPEEERQLLTSWSSGLDFHELGEALGVSRSQAHVLFHRCAAHARALVADYFLEARC